MVSPKNKVLYNLGDTSLMYLIDTFNGKKEFEFQLVDHKLKRVLYQSCGEETQLGPYGKVYLQSSLWRDKSRTETKRLSQKSCGTIKKEGETLPPWRKFLTTYSLYL